MGLVLAEGEGGKEEGQITLKTGKNIRRDTEELEILWVIRASVRALRK